MRITVSLSSRPKHPRGAVAAWAAYDFANSAFTTLVVTFVFSTYFTSEIAESAVSGTALWSRAVALSQIAVAFLSPWLGLLADRNGLRRRFLVLSTLLCIAASAGLYFAGPGDATFALVVFAAGNIAFELANVFYNAFLPELAAPQRIGRISGYGWALGYAGGLGCLLIGYFVFVAPETPPFGLVQETGEHVRATNLLVAVWYAVFSIPLFLILKKSSPSRPIAAGEALQTSLRELGRTLREVRRSRDLLRLLIARLVYNDGLITLFAFGGIYATGTFGFSTEDIFIFGIALNVAAGVGAWAFGFLDDRLGGRATIFISLAALTLGTFIAVFATSVGMFWAAAILGGLCAGPNQSASRSLMGRFIPAGKENEYYGLFAFSGKATAFLGPALLGIVTELFNSQRAGMVTVAAFFIAGAALLRRVDEQRGIAAARARERSGNL